MEKMKPEAIRIQQGLSQAEFCDLLGMTKATYFNKRTGKSKWYVDELYRMTIIGGLESIDCIDFSIK